MTNSKTCFVIMPISDHLDYQEGHFLRVYKHLINPACEEAGFTPIRADDVINTNYIAIDILKKIVESEMVICDLSSQNPNVLYELGIRQAFDKPVVFIKDSKTKRIFDIQGFRDFQYDETLRVDTVQAEISKLAQVIKSTYEGSNGSINSLISLLSIEPAKIGKFTEISRDTELILNSLSNLEMRIGSLEERKIRSEKPSISTKDTESYRGVEDLPKDLIIGEKFSIEELLKLESGDVVFHAKFGVGKVVSFDTKGPNKKGIFNFSGVGSKTLLLDMASLFKIMYPT